MAKKNNNDDLIAIILKLNPKVGVAAAGEALKILKGLEAQDARK